MEQNPAPEPLEDLTACPHCGETLANSWVLGQAGAIRNRMRRTHGSPPRKPKRCRYCKTVILGKDLQAHLTHCPKRPPRPPGRPPQIIHCMYCNGEGTTKSVRAHEPYCMSNPNRRKRARKKNPRS